jgi:hypothetical protein
MKAIHIRLMALTVTGLLLAGGAQANNLLNSLSDAANQQLGNNGSSAGNGNSMGQLSSLLSGSDNNLTAKSRTNAAGILGYCVKNNLLSASSATSVKDKLMSKLGMQNASTAQKTDYQDGLGGILHSGNGQNLDLNNLGSGMTQIKEKVKEKACNVVLKQAKSFI